MNIGTKLKKNQRYALELAQRAKELPADCGDPSGIVEACVDYAVSYIPKADIKDEVKRMEGVLLPVVAARRMLAKAATRQLGTGSRANFPALAEQVHEFCDLYERTVPKDQQQAGYIQTLRAATSPQKVYNTLHRMNLDREVPDYKGKKVFEERIKVEFGLSDKKPEVCC